MGELVSEGTSFSCSRCSSKLKISVPASLAESESKKLANTGNYVFLPPGGMCSATQSLCTPSISTTDPGQTVVQIDGKMALGAGCKLECSKRGVLTVDSPGQTTSTHESTLHKVLEGVAAAAAVAALFIPVVGEVEVGVGAAAEVGAMEAAEGASAIEESEAAGEALTEDRLNQPASRLEIKQNSRIKKRRNAPPDPSPEAEGRAHSIIERPGPKGQYTTHYGDGTWKQYRGSGKPHGKRPRPNIKETKNQPSPTGPRPGIPTYRDPEPHEIPK